MKLHTLGIGYRHESGFWIDRPGGSGDNLLLIFGSPARVVLPGGEYHVPPQSAVLYRRGTRQSYGSDGGAFVNHWLHLECPEEDPIFQILPFDTVICVSPAVPYEDLMTRLSREQLSESPYKERYADLLIRMLLLKLGEGARPGNAVFPRPGAHAEALQRLRAELYSSSARPVRIAELAARLSLSEPHFQALYRTQFGVSCYEDILRARLGTARYYLQTTSLSVKEIAALCGYENPEHFMRQFKSRTGQTPSEFRGKTREM